MRVHHSISVARRDEHESIVVVLLRLYDGADARVHGQTRAHHHLVVDGRDLRFAKQRGICKLRLKTLLKPASYSVCRGQSKSR